MYSLVYQFTRWSTLEMSINPNLNRTMESMGSPGKSQERTVTAVESISEKETQVQVISRIEIEGCPEINIIKEDTPIHRYNRL